MKLSDRPRVKAWEGVLPIQHAIFQKDDTEPNTMKSLGLLNVLSEGVAR